MLISTVCKFCSTKINFNPELKRAFDDGSTRIHICANRIIKCKFCKQPIYFSIKKNKDGKKQAFDAVTQKKHKCKEINLSEEK